MTDRTAEDLPAPWPDVLDALRSISGANQDVFNLVNLIRSRHDEDIEELRDEMRALASRIAAVER